MRTWEIEYSDGKPYNLQRPMRVAGMELHPIVLAKFQKGWEPSDEVARLIEAAPELLEALKAVLEDGLQTNVKAWQERARAAVAKAEGNQ